MGMAPEQQQQIAADVGAGASSVLAAVTWMQDLEFYLQLGATVVAIVAGAAAAWFHIEKARALRAARKGGENADRKDEKP